MTNQELIDYIRRQLGDPNVDVELEQEAIQDSINNSLKRWGRRNPTEKLGTVAVSAGVQKYVLSAGDVGQGILSMCPEPVDDNFSTTDFNVFDTRIWTLPSFNLADIAILDVYLDDLKELTNTTFEWYFDKYNLALYIAPSPPESYILSYKYADNPTVEEATAIETWVENYALAKAKGVVGMIRRKHGDRIPGSELDIQLDGSSLIQESKEEVRDLEEELKQIAPDFTPPIIG